MQIICDSKLTLEEALHGKEIPVDIRESLVLLEIDHLSYDGKLHRGQLVVHQEIAAEVSEIFAALRNIQFPIEKIIPIVKYDWDDEASMADNNTSAFNYRLILGTDRLSNHSFGKAIDINARTNPYLARDGVMYPPDAVYDPKAQGALADGEPSLMLFKDRGWTWGGDWQDIKDWQHLEKTESRG